MSRFCLTSDMLYKYQDGQLSKFKKFLVEKHLAKCKYCLDNLIITNKLYNAMVLNNNENNPISPELTQLHIKKMKDKYLESSHSNIFNSNYLLNKVKTWWMDSHERLVPLIQIPVLAKVRNPFQKVSGNQIRQVKKQFHGEWFELCFIMKSDDCFDLSIKPMNRIQKRRMVLKKNENDFLSEIIDQSYTINNLSFDMYTLSFEPYTEKDIYIFKVDKDGIHEFKIVKESSHEY